MAVDLNDYVEVLKREVTPLGQDLFSNVGDETFVGYLADALWEAMLDGLVDHKWSADEDGLIPDVDGEAFPRESIALLVLYSGIRILRLRILNTSTRFSAKAGPAEFTQEQSANALTEMLKSLDDIKKRLLKEEDIETVSYLVDGYTVRLGL